MKIAFSFGAILLAALHQFLPGFRLEPMTLTLLGIALLIWFVDRISSLDIPGVGKITFRDAKAATDKINISAKPQPGKLQLEGHVPEIMISEGDRFIVELAKSEDRDPSLMLIAFRIEIETRVRTLVRVHKLLNERVGLNRMIRALVAKQIIDASTGTGLIELVALGNQAAHGSEVGDDAAEWVLDVGPSVLLQLDLAIAAVPDDG